MKIAQGAANDCARSWLGFHEYPDPDLYALFAAWDATNLCLMVEIPNLDDASTIDNDKYVMQDHNSFQWDGQLIQEKEKQEMD